MKLVSIRLHNYLSHPDTVLELDSTRLAAFVGPNGAGKSALLEAVKYVLFDDGRARTDQLVRLGETDMSAAIEFDFAGATYRAVRGRSTKGAGKTYLELHVRAAEGSWTPLTGDDIRDTQARIVELLGLDADTFATAAFLGQGDADRFAAATAGERKRILGAVLGLGVYEKAEVLARDEARTLEASTAMDRSTLERLGDAIVELEPAPALLVTRKAEIDELAKTQTAAAAERDRLTGRLTELAAEIAKGDAAAAEVIRLEQERTLLADRYRREQKTIVDAAAAADAARATLATAGDVDTAVAELPVALDALAELDALETEDRRIAAELQSTKAELDALERPYELDHAAWSVRWKDAKKRATELEEHGRAGTSVCQACGQPISQGIALAQLAAARATATGLEAAEPKRPLAIDRQRATVARLESKRPKVDHAVTAAARERVTRLMAAAARGEAIAAARVALETSKTSAAEATVEVAKIGAAGVQVAEQLAVAKDKIFGIVGLQAEQGRVQGELTTTAERIRILEGQRHEAERSLATIEANVARLEQLCAERTEVADRLAGTDVELGLLRRLVAAFGVTGIPARIIESVLPELAGYANELLADLRPGMVLDIRAQREKRSGKGVVEALDLIVRDDVGERPLSVFSGGERMSVSLAIATALSRLVARRAGTAIRTLVVDEPDGLDADARRAFGLALRILAHHGELERVCLISHHADLAEDADQVWQVTKNGSGSVVEQLA